MKANLVFIFLFLSAGAWAQQLTLAQAAQEAALFSRQVKSRAAAVEAARQGINQANAMRMPKLSYQSALTTGNDPVYVFGSLLRQDSFTAGHFDLDKLNSPDNRTNFSNALSLEVPLFTGFKIRDQRALGENYLAQSQSSMDFTQQAELFAATQNYLMLALKTQLAKIAAQTQTSAQEQLKTADRLRSKGFVLGSDYYAAQAVLSSIKTNRTVFENDILSESAALSVRLGRDPKNILKPSDGFAPFIYDLGNESEKLAKLSQTRGDIITARLEAKNADIARSLESNSLLPQIGVFAQLQTNTRDFSTNPLLNTVGVSMTVPFGDFTRSPRVKQREAQKLQAQEQANALADAAASDLLRYRREYESAKAALPAAREAVANAQQSLELFKPLFRQGRQSVLEVVRAEAALMAARSSLAEITFKLHFYYAASLFMAGEFDQAAAQNISAALNGGSK